MKHHIESTTPMKMIWDDESQQPAWEIATIHSHDTWVINIQQLLTMAEALFQANGQTLHIEIVED